LYDFVAEYKDLSFQKRLKAEESFETAKTIEKILKPTFREIRQSILMQKVAEMHLGYTLSYYELWAGYGPDVGEIGMELNFVKTAIRKPVAGSKLNTRLYKIQDQLTADVINAIRQVVTEKMEYKQVVDLIEDRIATSRRKRPR
jgi:glyceraldehyde-3-phosphate dehydrogenase/erythrose-4-phosphate dehydrogenase